MALFGSKKSAKTKETKPVKEAKAVKTVSKTEVAVSSKDIKTSVGDASIIIRPRITEKSGILSQGGVYTFEVANHANKATVSKAMISIYKVNPIKVAIVNIPAKNVFVKGRKGTVSGFKKAIVTLKKGEKIEFV